MVVAGTLLAANLVVCSAPALALNPALDVSQYSHTSWKIADGFPAGAINAIAQTLDGYLWLGTDAGLFRFDGIRAVLWNPANQRLPSDRILGLVASRDGTLWIGTDKRVAAWRDGMLIEYEGPAEEYRVNKLLEDRDGVVWATVYVPRSNTYLLCSFQSGGAKCSGQDGGPGDRKR